MVVVGLARATGTDGPHLASMVRAVAHEAERDAIRVHAFLSAAGRDRSPTLTRDVLLHLAVGLRLLTWALAGVTTHRAAGLPAGRDVVVAALQAAAHQATLDPDLPIRVVWFHAENFSWDAGDFDADVLIDVLDGADAIDAIAEFVWAARHVARRPRAEG
jgi:hypothetical protein